ncbi:MAG: DUF1850 domain-containing protein [Bacillota bacterium]|nr:DUF1850 domain-containing protein [Bacillota bacterium]
MNMLTNHWKKAIIILFTILIMILLLIHIPVLVISERDSDKQLFIPLVREKAFSLEYVHSVQKTPVQEHFVLAPDNQLLLTSTHYQSYGVGLPYLPEEGNLVNDHGVFLLSGINRLFNEVNMGFMPLAKHGLIYHGKHYYFKNYFTSGALLQITVQEYSPIKTIWLMREGGK